MKKLFISIFTCVFALFALGTSTFAWFSMNNEVTADGMSITIKSGASFLLIAPGTINDADDIQTLNAVSATAPVDTASASLYPVAHDAIANTSDANTWSKWYYQYMNDPTVSMPREGNAHDQLTEKHSISSSDNYVLVNTFSLTIADGGNEMDEILVACHIVPGTGGAEAVKVLVTTENAAVEFSGQGGSDTTTNLLGSTPLSATTTLVVSVYIYWDGQDADVHTNGIPSLKNTTVDLVFTGNVVEGVNP